MKNFVATESSSGRLIQVRATDAEEAYKVIGRALYGMTDPIDTGDVDVDIVELRPLTEPGAAYLTAPGADTRPRPA